MLLQDGTIKVTDFGIARFARSEQRTVTDKAIGSVHYISPEQAKGEATDAKSDLYSVGVFSLRNADRKAAIRRRQRRFGCHNAAAKRAHKALHAQFRHSRGT